MTRRTTPEMNTKEEGAEDEEEEEEESISKCCIQFESHLKAVLV